MATVEIIGVALVRELFGAKKLTYPFEGELTVFDLLEKLDEQYGLGNLVYNEDKSISESIRIFLRGRDIRFLETGSLSLHDGDTVLIMPILAGG
ncbi:MAG: MoaD/ThiS family protein [Firmicutes bacterium]|nr:MoaD/ThiS family protein [Bacillota bacterium]